MMINYVKSMSDSQLKAMLDTVPQPTVSPERWTLARVSGHLMDQGTNLEAALGTAMMLVCLAAPLVRFVTLAVLWCSRWTSLSAHRATTHVSTVAGALTALDMLALGGAILHARMPDLSASFGAERGLCLGGSDNCFHIELVAGAGSSAVLVAVMTSYALAHVVGRLNAHTMCVASEGPAGVQRKMSWRLPYWAGSEGDILDDWSAM